MGKLVTMVKLAMWLVFNTMVRSGTMVSLMAMVELDMGHFLCFNITNISHS